MNLDTVKQMAHKWAGENINPGPPSPNARFITGDYVVDSKIYHFEQESGIALDISGFKLITGYKIIDEKKCAWFILKWS